MRIAITGAGGRLGKALRAAASARGHDAVAWGRAELDVRDAAAARQAVAAARPAWVINCAAMTNVDECEGARDEALRVNGAAVAALGAAAQHVRARLCQVSTDYVFAGAPDRAPYREGDDVGPVNQYGTAKLAGERAAMRWGGALVARVALLYGDPDRPAFIEKVFERARAGERIQAAADMAGSPTFAPAAANAILALCEQEREGVWHVAGAGGATRHAQAVVAAEAVRPGARVLVDAVAAEALKLPARRPPDARLDTTKLVGEAGVALPPWEETVRAWAALWLERASPARRT